MKNLFSASFLRRTAVWLCAFACLAALPGWAQDYRAYIPNSQGNTVSVFDLPNQNLLATVTVVSKPNAVAFSPDGTKVYVGSDNSPDVSVIDRATNAVVATITIPGGTIGTRGLVVSPDGQRVYAVTLRNPSVTPRYALSILNAATNAYDSEITGIGNARQAIVVSPDGKKVYIGSQDYGSQPLAIVDLPTQTVSSVTVGEGPNQLAITPDGQKVYAISDLQVETDTSLFVVNTATNAVDKIPVGNAQTAVRVSPDGSRAYVLNSFLSYLNPESPEYKSKLTVIDVATNQVIAALPLNILAGQFDVSPDGGLLYLLEQDPDSVSVFNTTTNALVSRFGASPDLDLIIGGFIPLSNAYLGLPVVSEGPLCPGQSFTLTFEVIPGLSGPFTAYLSDASGNFPNGGTSLGTVVPGQPNTLTIPVGAPAGTQYRIRVVSGDGQVISSPSLAFGIRAPYGDLSKVMPVTVKKICQTDGLLVQLPGGGPNDCPIPQGAVLGLELSNFTGSFIKPRPLTGTVVGNFISIPPSDIAGLIAGTGYRVRFVGNPTAKPPVFSPASFPFEIEAPNLAPAPGVSGAPVCRGGQVTVTYGLASCPFFEGNVFTAQLSSFTGSFNNPTSLGTVVPGQANPVTIPATMVAGSGYRIRLVSSNPVVASTPSQVLQVKACASRMSAEEAQLVVAPNPVVGGEIRCRVAGMDNPAFSLTTAGGRSLSLGAKTDGSGEFVLTPRQRLAVGVYILQASEGSQRLTQRVVVAE